MRLKFCEWICNQDLEERTTQVPCTTKVYWNQFYRESTVQSDATDAHW